MVYSIPEANKTVSQVSHSQKRNYALNTVKPVNSQILS